MVKLNKIYTRTGDDGTTGLGTGTRVSKASLRVECYGTVDEAGAALGCAISACEQSSGICRDEIAPVLRSIGHDLFDAGADLCIPIDPKSNETEDGQLRITPQQTERLESLIDRFNAELDPLKSFVLSGGSPAASALHLARTIVRRAERLVVHLIHEEPVQTSPEVVRYLNRLSDLLFVLARVANDNGKNDVLWKPGTNR
ncbi:MAG: cob(I)yrinic acid a,c-diamide adenosyltransferase [Phycisphaeraceae bacterium]|nr:cob(I)yrinic acid a,c-diamide adenosyltransferase [Phycisphaerales bacterium]MCB9860113.1 cob(I)yrinic acid a,c-diamide adenosyltransferase [Phycisphaeraceae bacterium]